MTVQPRHTVVMTVRVRALRRNSVTLAFVFQVKLLFTTTLFRFIIPGFIISGGYLGSSGSTRKVELFNPSSGNSCPVQDMRSPRYLHSSCSGLVCGGGDSKRSCEKIMATDISPHPSLELRRKRQHHLCWRLPNDNKILLLGFSSSTTEIVSGESYTSDSFKLKDLTRYISIISLSIIQSNYEITLQLCLWDRCGRTLHRDGGNGRI